MSEHVADPAAGQHVPQADSPILASAGQHHGLWEQVWGPGHCGATSAPRCPSARVGGRLGLPLGGPGTSSQESETRPWWLWLHPHPTHSPHLVDIHSRDGPRVALQGEEAARILQTEHLRQRQASGAELLGFSFN